MLLPLQLLCILLKQLVASCVLDAKVKLLLFSYRQFPLLALASNMEIERDHVLNDQNNADEFR